MNYWKEDDGTWTICYGAESKEEAVSWGWHLPIMGIATEKMAKHIVESMTEVGNRLGAMYSSEF